MQTSGEYIYKVNPPQGKKSERANHLTEGSTGKLPRSLESSLALLLMSVDAMVKAGFSCEYWIRDTPSDGT